MQLFKLSKGVRRQCAATVFEFAYKIACHARFGTHEKVKRNGGQNCQAACVMVVALTSLRYHAVT